MHPDEYQRSRNPRGLHNHRAAHCFYINGLIATRMSRDKIIASQSEGVAAVLQTRAAAGRRFG